MDLSDLMEVMREEFASAAEDTDAGLMAWFGDDPAQAPAHADQIAQGFQRLARTAEVIGLEGAAVALDHLGDTAQALGQADADHMGIGLGWLASWRGVMEPCFQPPVEADAAGMVIDYLALCPLPVEAAVLAVLHESLMRHPRLPEADASSVIEPATDEDVSLEVPADVDHDLLATLLTEAPGQLARLGDHVRALRRGTLGLDDLAEAQRVAHTLKGSGNIIGIVGVARVAHRVEDLLDFAQTQGARLPARMGHDVEQAVALMDQMVGALRGEESPPEEARACLQGLIDWGNAIQDGSWEERAAEEVPTRASVPAPASASALAPATPSLPVVTTPAPGTTTPFRVAVTGLDRLVRRAGQALIQSARLNEHLRKVEERLKALEQSNQRLRGRLGELQQTLDRQGVGLQERAASEGRTFDALEMDRYSDLHTLSRFVAELAADELDLALAAQAEVRRTQTTAREQSQVLRDQHRDLMAARLVPFRQITARLRRNVSQTAAATGKLARLEVEGEDVPLDSEVLERLTEPLLHLLRNAVDHGLETSEERAFVGKAQEGVITLRVVRDGQSVVIECRDDGRGLDLPAIHERAMRLGLADEDISVEALARVILLPGFSTRDRVTDISGRGVGLDVVADRVQAMKGRIDIGSQPFEGTTFTLRLPASMGMLHALVVSVAGEPLALATRSVVTILAPGQGLRTPGWVRHAERDIEVRDMGAWLNLREPVELVDAAAGPLVLVRVRDTVLALQVDSVVETQELILQETGRLLRRIPGLAGSVLRPDGRVMFLIDPEALDSRSQATLSEGARQMLRQRVEQARTRVLVVDDSLSVRKALAQLLEDTGYAVSTAGDGFEALQVLQRQPHDIVLTDLEMPNLNGLDLTRQLRQAPGTEALPVLMITSRSSDKHRRSATEAGVTRYLTKPCPDAELLAQVRELVAA